MHPLFAAAPLVLAAALILLARQSALRAGGALLLAALLTGWLHPASPLGPALTLEALWRALAITLPIAYILLGGVCLYQVLRAGGALDTIARLSASAAPDPGLRILLLTYGLGVFFESTTGFGVGIIVTAPLLLGLGYRPLQAGLLALLGQCAVPWGALAVGTSLGAKLAGLPLASAGLYALLFSLLPILFCGVAALRVARVEQPLWRSVLQAGGLAAALCGGIALSTLAGAPELAGCIGGLTVIALVLALRRVRPPRPPTAASASGRAPGRFSPADPCPAATAADRRDTLRCLAPLALLVGALALTRLVAPLGGWLSAPTLRSDDGLLAIAPLYHAGFWLLAAAGVALLRLPRARWPVLVRSALTQWLQAVLAVAGFIAAGQAMALAGMTEALTAAAARAPRAALPLLMSPVGALGGFLTASNAGSNAIFMTFQVQLSALAQFDLNLTAAAQNAAASFACMMSPGRLALARLLIGSDAGEDVGEHRLLRAIAPVTLLCVLAIALLLALTV